MFQLSHLYMTTGKTIALPIQTFVSKVMFYNRLSRFVRDFLPRSKRLLISWLQSLSTEILEPKKIKSATGFTFPPLICHEVMGQDAMIFVLGMLHFQFSSVQPLSHVQLFATPWTAACQASLSITNSWSLLKLMSSSSW